MNKTIKLVITLITLSFSVATVASCEGKKPVRPTNPTASDDNFFRAEYSNPLIPATESGGQYNGEFADPHIAKDGDMYYVFSTGRSWAYSDDAVNWTLSNTKVIDRPTWGDQIAIDAGITSKPEVWAPDIKYVAGQWIYYYSLSTWGCDIGIGYAVADSLAGPWIDMGKLFTSDEIGIDNCIDPAPFIDDDERVYLAVGSFQGIFLIELDEDGTTVLNDDIAAAKANKVCLAGYGSSKWDGSQYEGAYIAKKGEYYYFFGSTGTCCAGSDSSYQVRCGRSKNVAGPYVDSKGVPLTMSRDGNKVGEIVIFSSVGEEGLTAGPGHNSILVDDKGDWWLCYHSYTSDTDWKARHLMLDRLVWNDKGFPQTQNKKPSAGEVLDGPAIAK